MRIDLNVKLPIYSGTLRRKEETNLHALTFSFIAVLIIFVFFDFDIAFAAIVMAVFGDAAAAVLLEPTTEDVGIIDHIFGVDGSGRHYLYQKAGGSARPASHKTVDAKEHFIHQEGQAVFKFAVTKMADVSVEMMKKHNLTSKDLAWLVPHQANMRIILATAKRMGLEREKIMINIERYGNTTTATIPLCLWEWENKLHKGDNIILVAFGGGFTWGALYIKWAYDGNK